MRHLFATFRAGQISARQAVADLGIRLSRFYQLWHEYVRACAQGRAEAWTPGLSGGDHQRPWPTPVVEPLTQLLSSQPPNSYSAAASEVLRVHRFAIDRASVRRWAIHNQLAPDTRYKKALKPIRRWQVQERGALWQYDASPHAWLPRRQSQSALWNLLDDATRFNVAVRLYERETLLAHFEFLPRAFSAHGLPLALYVDYHSFYFTHTPDAFTQVAPKAFGVLRSDLALRADRPGQRQDRTPPRLLAAAATGPVCRAPDR